ncbi:zf-TFIIB domain-containing protein [Stenotrophomonas lacuserhaii]|uniref:TFIIB-type zinc ribbon-containing protein n=1 Tax=Stenotrophomonas lacuserhaii TaxID=2760084 RepID=UPI0015F969E6|nr:zf-TFIIB domain-containing protein [Stenotrophomonas lacuserhaii]
MLCPVCKTQALTMSERQGIEIDYCPQCRGVWLDRGELDKIIERSASAPSVPPPAPVQAAAPAYSQPPPPPVAVQHRDTRHLGQRHNDGYAQQGQYNQHGYRKKKKESFLSDLFDF